MHDICAPEGYASFCIGQHVGAPMHLGRNASFLQKDSKMHLNALYMHFIECSVMHLNRYAFICTHYALYASDHKCTVMQPDTMHCECNFSAFVSYIMSATDQNALIQNLQFKCIMTAVKCIQNRLKCILKKLHAYFKETTRVPVHPCPLVLGVLLFCWWFPWLGGAWRAWACPAHSAGLS